MSLKIEQQTQQTVNDEIAPLPASPANEEIEMLLDQWHATIDTFNDVKNGVQWELFHDLKFIYGRLCEIPEFPKPRRLFAEFYIAKVTADIFLKHKPKNDPMPFIIYDEMFENLEAIAFDDADDILGYSAVLLLIDCANHAKYYGFSEPRIQYNKNKLFHWQRSISLLPYYLHAARIGGARDWEKLGSVYYEGVHTTRSCLYAFYWMLKAAAHKNLYAMGELSGYLENGKGIEADFGEAYTWTLIFKDHHPINNREELEDLLSTREQNKAQAEARRREKLLKNGTHEKLFQEMLERYHLVETGDIEDPVVQMIQAPEPKVSKKRSRFGDISEEEKKRVGKLGEWEPDSPAEITMEYYLLEQKIRFRYKRKSVTVKATSVFEPSHLKLLKAFYDMKHKEGPNIAPKNNSIVGPDKRQLNNSLSYGFNNVFRRLFNKGKDFKAFYWDHMELKSKINLELK